MYAGADSESRRKEVMEPLNVAEIVPKSRPSAQARPKKEEELLPVERCNWLIHLHFARNELDMCKKLIKDQLEDTNGQGEFALYTQGLILRQEGKIKESFDIFRQCVNLNPKNMDNIKQVANSLAMMGRTKEAVAMYGDLSKTNTEDWEVWHKVGECYLRLKDYRMAVECLQKALQLCRRRDTFERLAEAYWALDDVTAALEVYNKATQYFPNDADTHCNLGKLYLQLGAGQKAFERIGTCLALDPQHPAAILATGAITQTYGDFDAALAKYRTMAAKDADSAPLWNNVGMGFYSRKKYVAAISCLKRALYLTPLEWRILYNLGLVHLTMQQYSSAFNFLSAAIALKPRFGRMYMMLAVALTYLTDAENARLAYTQALKFDMQDPMISLNYAVFSYNIGDAETAIEHLSAFQQKRINYQRTTELDTETDPKCVELASRMIQAVAKTTGTRKAPEPSPSNSELILSRLRSLQTETCKKGHVTSGPRDESKRKKATASHLAVTHLCQSCLPSVGRDKLTTIYRIYTH